MTLLATVQNPSALQTPARLARPRMARPSAHRLCKAAQSAFANLSPSLAPHTPKLLPNALQTALSRNARIGADLLSAAIWENQPVDTFGHHLTPVQQKILAEQIERQRFTGKKGQHISVPLTHNDRLLHVALVGLGRPDAAAAFDAGKSVAREGARQGAKHVVVLPPEPRHDVDTDDVITHLVRGLHLGTYRYQACKSQPKPVETGLTAVAQARKDGHQSQAALRGVALAEATALARDLVNSPPNRLTPEAFADIARTQAEMHGLTCRVLAGAELEARGMNLITAVGQGSQNAPRLVHLTYRPAGLETREQPDVALVGKGITFDSGGLCIKPAGSMLNMKVDMGGAAAVLGAIVGAARMDSPLAVDAVLALAENSISGAAYRPGDVYTSAAGKTVEIINTDAEGRLVLADALHFASMQGAPQIIDVATLTGACVVALGNATAGLFCNDTHLTSELLQASHAVGESIWHMPLCSSLTPELHSRIADLKNLGAGSGGGAITAALFLQEFVGDARWAHLDIAGPVMNEEGATGFAAATLAEHVSPIRS